MEKKINTSSDKDIKDEPEWLTWLKEYYLSSRE
jgi:hypothetical protein